MNYMQKTSSGVLLAFALLFGWTLLEWSINRIEVPVGHSLQLRYKGPLIFGYRRFAASRFAVRDQGGVQEIGVLEHMPGPGRHFYCPLWWERKIVKDVEVKPGELGFVTSKLGESLPPGEFLVDGEIGDTKHAGILRKVYAPGRYRVNPYGYEFTTIKTEISNAGAQAKHSGWVEIPTGYVGVVTTLAKNDVTGERPGIQDKVLQPGIYLLNPRERVIDIVLVGYYEKSIATQLMADAQGRVVLEEGEPQLAGNDSGISFPSSDGFTIHLDFSAIWGVMPAQAPDIIRNFGNLKAVENKIITPQIESIARNTGSQYSAPDLLTGETREEFQSKLFESFQSALKEKDITLLSGLVRYIYIPRQVRVPIQRANLANELRLTSQQKEVTAKTEGVLREAEKNVDLAGETVRVETEKKVALVKADSQRTAAETEGGTQKMLAEIDRNTAELDRQSVVLLGEATSKSRRLLEEAKADRFQLAVAAFGNAAAFNQYTFASKLPDRIRLDTLYAGEGTFWTDLKGFSETMLGRQQQATERKAVSHPTK